MKTGESGFIFWQKFLLYSSIMIGIGVIPLFLTDNPLFMLYEQALSTVLNGSENFSPETQNLINFIRGPFTGTLACSYFLLAFIAAFPFRQKKKWSRNAIILSFGLWFIFDTTFCLYQHVYFQVYIINLLSLFQKALPIVFTWHDFNTHPDGVGVPRRGV